MYSYFFWRNRVWLNLYERALSENTANGREEKESQPLICTTLTSTLSVDEAELSNDESNECTENVVNSPNDKQSTTPHNAAQHSFDAGSNI